ncbi:EAL domain-containing protein [Rhodoferax sp. AJA081-3]|uniref:bifunctional diguanylate cyclase/phosphodiesterase n=1 Tax=Rhodoferax sp. AJA081-3 TaxID=2752316 RepID=UPI001ADF1298|nr:bifunctional diguanylate cyclase/phosphodiesterase [Rhodoferax sp. AJA081-3]QTN26166.1 EAL domain-containing protein [Rhodoferax sp. AJA081-3]
MQKISFTTWLARGTYPRLYLPIIAIILVVSVVRYDLLIKAEVKEVQLQRQDRLQHMQHYLVPRLLAQSASGEAASVKALLDAEARLNPDILSLRWQHGDATTAASLAPGQGSHVPGWFQRLSGLEQLETNWPVPSVDGLLATLSVQLGADHAQERVWNTVGSQLPISALNIFTILFLLTLLVRSNARMLQRLDSATSQFRAGQLQTRMAETGTLEARASARTFNLMASEIQRLVKSLEKTQKQQEEQLHFTRQLVDALPLPVFVRTSDGTCLSVNKAWERLFDTPAATVVGSPMRSDFVPIEPARASKERRTVPRESNEVLIRSGAFDVREMSYFKAAFSTTDGAEGGTISALVDITERKLAQDELVAEKERAEVTLSSIGDGVITTDMAGFIESINEVAQFLTGHTSAHAVGRSLTAVFNLDSTSQALPYGTALHALHATTKRLHAVNQILVHRSGERYPIEFTAAPIRRGNGPHVGCVLVFRDISETRDLQQQISWQATHDALTGLNNRTALAERLTHAIFQARQDDGLLAVCLLDLDHFQAINEQYGNTTGDLLLKEVGQRLMDIAPDPANIARLGGDEFVVLLPGHADVASIHAQAQQLLQRIAQPYAIGDQQITLTASVGVSIFPLDNANPDTLMRHADQAMCQAKQTGRNRIHQFDAQNDLNIQTQHSQITRITYGLRSGEMRLFYQPKVNMRSGRILGYEALMRWEHPERGIVSPGEFLPLIEQTDLIVEAGHWALHKAMAQLDEWVQQGHDWVVSVNIAARHFHTPDFVESMRQLLAQYPRVPSHLLELEILESAALQDVAHMREVMQACQALGLQFALDDFGTGFSSLSYLKQLPAETIKIDRSFVDGLLSNADDRTLVSAIVGLSQAFTRSVIAEGVETPEQAGKLLSLGCELGQGYGICKPMPLAQVKGWAAQYTLLFEPA